MLLAGWKKILTGVLNELPTAVADVTDYYKHISGRYYKMAISHGYNQPGFDLLDSIATHIN